MIAKAERAARVARSLTQGFLSIYPGEAAQLLNELPVPEVLELMRRATNATLVVLMRRLNPDVAAQLIEEMDNELFVRVFTELDAGQGATLLARLEKGLLERRIALLPKQIAREYEELLSYPAETAGSLMDPRVTAFSPDDTVKVALSRIREIGRRRIVDVCVINDEGVLIGLIPLQVIAVSQPATALRELIERQPVSVQDLAPRDDVVQLLEQRKLTSLPVVDIQGKLLGIIRYDALVSAAQQEASEDVQAMFGAGRDERALSKVSFAIKKRLPWLEINLATAFLAAAVVGMFEDTIARITVLAVFLPVVAGQSGNTGSQALAVTIRGLALREIRTRHWFQIARKEVAVGFLNGLAVAVTTSLVAYLWMRSAGLSVVIGVAMVISMVIAGMSGAVIPVILKAFGQDPAQSSSIILTTVTDVVGFLSFLGLATVLAGALGIS